MLLVKKCRTGFDDPQGHDHIGVSINGGTPKWMVYQCLSHFIMENPIKMDDLEVPLFQEPSIYMSRLEFSGE